MGNGSGFIETFKNDGLDTDIDQLGISTDISLLNQCLVNHVSLFTYAFSVSPSRWCVIQSQVRGWKNHPITTWLASPDNPITE